MITQTNKTRLLAYLLAVVGCFPLGTFRSEEKPSKKETAQPKQQQTRFNEPASSPAWIYSGGSEAILTSEQRYLVSGSPTENARVLHPLNKALSNAGLILFFDAIAAINETPDVPQTFPIAKAESCEYRITFDQPLLQGGGAGGLPA